MADTEKTSSTTKTGGAGPRPVRAPRGTEISCKGWQQEAARKHFSDTLKGKLVLTAGRGGMGGAQPSTLKCC
jgi:urocanate hydratase